MLPPMPTVTRHTADPRRRILSLWFPRLGADRVLRMEPALTDVPLVTVAETGNLRQVAATTIAAERLGLSRGQSLSEAMVLCPDLVTRLEDRGREAALLMALRRWAGKFSPWVAEEGANSLIIDLTGCAHLFGGEEALFAQVHEDCADLGLSVCAGIADTAGAAWALARYAGGPSVAPVRNGDAIDQEARATRSRARKRHWVKGGPAPAMQRTSGPVHRIAKPGGTRQVLAPLPIAALRVNADVTTGLARLGLRQIGDVLTLPRASLARRFGQDLMRRLDQALGTLPEPISPAGAPLHFAIRLSLPEPIGLEADIVAGLDRILPPLCEKLRAQGRGARRVRLELSRVEGDTQVVAIGLAQPADQPDKLKPLFEMKLGDVDAGFGIDRLRVIAHVTEPLHATEHKGGWAVAEDAAGPRSSGQDMADLIARLGARVGLEAIRRMRPADSHIPEKTSVPLAAAWSEAEPPDTWPTPTRARPLTLFQPEPVTAPSVPDVPLDFRWRGRRFQTKSAQGPERIAPEWWLEERQWRTGVRDYWRVTTQDGARLWLYFAHGGAQSGGWFAQGDFG